MKRLALVLACLLFTAACGGDSENNPAAPTPAGNGGAANGAASTPAATPAGGDPAGPLPEVNLQRVYSAVSIDEPTNLVPAPDGSWWALEREGRVLRFEDRNDAAASVVVDISDRVTASGAEQGLLGIAIAPDFNRSRAFYLNYTAPSPLRTVVSRFIANAANGDAAAPGSETVILTIDDFANNHNGGQMAFGNDGYLYFSIGDGGGGNDPQSNGQNINAMLGKIHRIDVSKPSGNLQYTIPPDNPFAGRNDARGEVWAYGFRNPWRFSFDLATGQLWVGDVGQAAREEVDLVTKGGNYGWKIMEGSQCRGGGNDCDRSGLIPPVIDYERANGRCSVTGGYVYRGSAIPSLRGAYVYGDYCSGEIWALRYDGIKVTEQAKIAELDGSLSTFAQGPDGEIYALLYANNGGVFKLTPK